MNAKKVLIAVSGILCVAALTAGGFTIADVVKNGWESSTAQSCGMMTLATLLLTTSSFAASQEIDEKE